METTLLVPAGDKTRIYPLAASQRVTTLQGSGRIVYLTTDGWVGVVLDGERIAQEFGAAWVKAVRS